MRISGKERVGGRGDCVELVNIKLGRHYSMMEGDFTILLHVIAHSGFGEYHQPCFQAPVRYVSRRKPVAAKNINLKLQPVLVDNELSCTPNLKLLIKERCIPRPRGLSACHVE